VRSLVKAALRGLVYTRLRAFPLSARNAIWWAEFMKRWPAIFMVRPYLLERQVETGARMRLGLIDVIERQLLLSGSWDDDVGQFMSASVRPGSTVIDVGANIGYFTLLASTLVGDRGIVLAIEPSQRNLSRLCEHLWLNRAGNVLVLSLAAGRCNGVPSISFPTYNNAGAATLRAVSTVQSQRTLQIALDDVFDAHSLSPDFIKLDVEGYELEALKGMEHTLRRCKPMVVCELTESFLRELGQSARELLAFMEGLGYSCEVLSDRGGVAKGSLIASTDSSVPLDQLDVVFRGAAVQRV